MQQIQVVKRKQSRYSKGVKVAIVEPGVIRTNFVDGLVVAKKSKDSNFAILTNNAEDSWWL